MRMVCCRVYCLLIGIVLPVTFTHAADPLGKTLLARGSVTADRNGANEALRRLSPVFRQDVLRSGANARAQFRMIDDAYINLQQNSELRLEEYELKPGTEEGSVVLELISGGLRTITGAVGKKNKKDYQLKTPVATIGIRGTMYEAEIAPEGMYAAAWRGQIWIRSYSGACDLTLGEGRPFRYALVNNAGECQTLSTIPKIFRDGHSSDSTEGTELAEVEIKPLLDSPQRQTFTFSSLLLGLAGNGLVDGQAESLNLSNTLLSDGSGVLSATEGAITDFAQNIGGYPVSWGKWSGYSIQTDDEVIESTDDANGLIWSAYEATSPADTMSRQGTVRYENMVGSLAQSSMGAVSNVTVQMDVNFDNGAVNNGIVAANVPNHTWAGIFDGQVSNGELSLEFNGGSLVDTSSGTFASVSGDISGDFVGDNAEAIAGGFSMLDETNNAQQIEGVFLVEQ